jgi:hypothetical protein
MERNVEGGPEERERRILGENRGTIEKLEEVEI